MENQPMNSFCCGTSSSRPFWIVASVLILVLTFYVLILGLNAIKSGKYIGKLGAAQGSTITVSDSSDVYAKPDLAVMDFTVVSQAKTVADAMADNTAKMNAVIEAVKKLGVDAKDLQTTNFYISPRYDYVREAVTTPTPAATGAVGAGGSAVSSPTLIYPNGKQVLAGYDVNQTLTVKMRDLAKVGQIIESATVAGANQAGSLQFTIDKPDVLEQQARGEAIVKAKAKAKELADQLGVSLGRITGFSENESAPYPIYAKSVAMDAAGTGGAAPSIETGQNKITASVSITYEIE